MLYFIILLIIIINNIQVFLKSMQGDMRMREKKSFKRFASLFLATSLFAGILAGCSETEEGTPDNSGTSGGGSTEEVIKIGANLELSGQCCFLRFIDWTRGRFSN